MTKEEFIRKIFGQYDETAARLLVSRAWGVATEEVKKDHFKIGEEVERKAPACNGGGEIESGWEKSKIVACSASYCSFCGGRVRRIPAWEPKDGEPVLAKSKSGKAFYAVSAGDMDIYDLSAPVSGIIEAYDIKPWKPNCQGKPWDEV